MLFFPIDYVHDWRNSKKDILSLTFHLNKQISLAHTRLSYVTAVVMASVSFVFTSKIQSRILVRTLLVIALFFSLLWNERKTSSCRDLILAAQEMSIENRTASNVDSHCWTRQFFLFALFLSICSMSVTFVHESRSNFISAHHFSSLGKKKKKSDREKF